MSQGFYPEYRLETTLSGVRVWIHKENTTIPVRTVLDILSCWGGPDLRNHKDEISWEFPDNLIQSIISILERRFHFGITEKNQ